MPVTLNDNALTTYDQISDEVGLSGTTDDEKIKRLINQYSKLFEDATGYVWYREDDVTVTTISTGKKRLYSPRKPLLTVDEIKIDGDVVDAADYSIESEKKGYIWKDTGTWESTAFGSRKMRSYIDGYEENVEITGDFGHVTQKQVDDGTFSQKTLPGSIERAVMDTVISKYLNLGGDARIQKESVGEASVTYKLDGSVHGQAVSQSFESAVSMYMNRGVI